MEGGVYITSDGWSNNLNVNISESNECAYDVNTFFITFLKDFIE